MHLVDTADFSVDMLPGRSKSAIVSFAAVGLAGMPPQEFRRALSGQSRTLFFVRDKRGQWYNGIDAPILTALNAEISARRITQVSALGNAMGGFAALAMAGRINNCDRVLAFSPQTAMRPDLVPFERRWAAMRAKITDWTLPDCVPLLRPGIAYVVLVGGRGAADIAHIDRLTKSYANVDIRVIPTIEHNVAKTLRPGGGLRRLINAVITTGSPPDDPTLPLQRYADWRRSV